MSDDTRERLREFFADRYALGDEIERGGMAVVYAAEDLKHRRTVAIKVLLPTIAASMGAERFLREIGLVARLQHPNILTLIDSGQANGLPYYVMPFVEGQSLADRLRRGAAVAVDEAVRIACEIADALEVAHNQGIVHRDIKPGNIPLSEGHAIVADFGIAGAADDAAVGRLTETGMSLGSPIYMSPEQATGERTLDRRTDIYSLGCVLYEMLAGQPPFAGSVQALLTQKVLGKVPPLRELRADTPPELERAVSKAMATAPEDRFGTAADFRLALLSSPPKRASAGFARRRRLAGAVAVLVAAAVTVTVVRARAEAARVAWAAEQLEEVVHLVEGGRYTDALALAEEVEAVFPEDTTLARLLPQFAFSVPIRTDPPGARVYLQSMDAPEDEWRDLGTTPVEEVRFAGVTIDAGQFGPQRSSERPWRIRFELEGYQDRELLLTAILGAAWTGFPPMDPVVLTAIDAELEGMVRMPGFVLAGVEHGDYYMDRYEVTNTAYKDFVDAGGYAEPRYWVHPIVRDGVEIGFADAMALFRDRTGRPGPSTWRLGTFPDGQADYPVGGVSWHEAAAYAQWAGKQLPTTDHWNGARRLARDDSYVVGPRSNLGSSGPRPVGQNRAMTSLGVYDVEGNVREWCYNEADEGARATRGAAWSDAPYHVGWIIPKPALDRDATNGFRLVRVDEGDAALAGRRTVSRTVIRDFRTEEPASDAEFAVFRRLYDYSPRPLNAVVERADTSEHWVREVVAFDLPDGERGGAVLFVPKTHRRPLQSVVYWSGGFLLLMGSVDEEILRYFDFIVRSGRIVAIPIFAGGYGRADPRPAASHGTEGPVGPEDHAYRDLSIQWVKDFRRVLDYLESRPDVDAEKMAYNGFSFGGRTAPQVLAVEPRLKAAVLNVGGLAQSRFLPEVDPFNFVPRVLTPVLMINGEHDIVFPYETSQRPMFERMGTPVEHKRLHVTPAAHLVPLDELVTHTLGWFDEYLGVPAGT